MSDRERIDESSLLKALTELEEVAGKKLRKSRDVLQAADPEGGLAHQGKPLSDKAPKGKVKKVAKAAKPPVDDDSSSDEDSDSSSAKPPFAKADDDESSMPDEDSSSDVSSDERKPFGKGFAADAAEDPNVRKQVRASGFLEGFLIKSGKHFDGLRKSVGELEDQLATERAGRGQFERKMAKALSALGAYLGDIGGKVQELLDQPSAPARRGVLYKGDVAEPPLERTRAGGEEERHPLDGVPLTKIVGWIEDKTRKGLVSLQEAVAFETNRYDLDFLPDHIQKALVNDLGTRTN